MFQVFFFSLIRRQGFGSLCTELMALTDFVSKITSGTPLSSLFCCRRAKNERTVNRVVPTMRRRQIWDSYSYDTQPVEASSCRKLNLSLNKGLYEMDR